METKKKKALKKILNITEKELNEIMDRVLEDWANNIIKTKYKTEKTVEDIVNELNE